MSPSVLHVVCKTPKILFGNGAQFELMGGYMSWGPGAPKWEYLWTVGGCAPVWKLDQAVGATVQYDLPYP